MPPAREDLAVFETMCKSRNIRLRRNPHVATPMLVGIFHPCIIIPNIAYAKNGMERELRNMLRHELVHYRRKDLVYKWLVMLVASLHWFNPLVYLIRREIAHACELACDEAVIAGMSASEKQSYGDTLIALAAERRFPAGILATTLCEEKERLKERLASIMQYKKKAAWAAVLSLLLALCLAGCGVVLGVATHEPESSAAMVQGGSGIAMVGGVSGPDEAMPSAPPFMPADTPDILDFDGDGLADEAFAERTPQASLELDPAEWNATLTVRLGSGKTLVHKIPGWWWLAESHTADFDADGRADIALMLEAGGSNYAATNVHVFCVENGGIVEFAKDIIPNGAVPYDHGGYTVLNDENCPWVSGGEVAFAGQKPMLRLRRLFAYDPGEGITVAYYTNLSWNGSGWLIESMEIGEAFGVEKLITPQTPQQSAPGELLPAVHRESFEIAELAFAPATSYYTWEGDPNAQGYDAYQNMLTLPAKELAGIALRTLYDMTGCQVKKCFVFCDGFYYCERMLFSLYEDGVKKPFLTADFNPFTGQITQMNIVWKQAGTEYSPVDPALLELPASLAGAGFDEVARWFYENSSFGERRAVVKAESNGIWAKLTLENGDFYEVGMQEAVGLPASIYGPYPDGFSH